MATNNTAVNGKPTSADNSGGLLSQMHKPAFIGRKSRTKVDIASLVQKLGTLDLTMEEKAYLEKWTKQKSNMSKNPVSLFKKHFGGDPKGREQVMRQSIDSIPKEIPQPVIGLLQKKIKGANMRIMHRKSDLQEIQFILKTGTREKNGKMVAITPSERKSYKQLKVQKQAELIKAVEDRIVYRVQLAEAVEKNITPVKESIKSVREMAYARRMAPSISKQITDYIESHTEAKNQLSNLKQDDAVGDVAEGFLEIVKGVNPKTLKMLVTKPKLATQVRQRVFEQVTQSK